MTKAKPHRPTVSEAALHVVTALTESEVTVGPEKLANLYECLELVIRIRKRSLAESPAERETREAQVENGVYR